jgi:hypothetical protein
MPVVRIDEYKTVGFAAITASFTTVGTPLSHNWRAFRATNNTNGNLILSLDGSTNNIFLPANSFVLYDITANTDTDNSTALIFAIGSQFYVKYSTAPTSGDLYIEGFYQKGQ